MISSDDAVDLPCLTYLRWFVLYEGMSKDLHKRAPRNAWTTHSSINCIDLCTLVP